MLYNKIKQRIEAYAALHRPYMSPINIIHFPSYYFKALKSNKEFIPCGKGQAYFDAILRNKKRKKLSL